MLRLMLPSESGRLRLLRRSSWNCCDLFLRVGCICCRDSSRHRFTCLLRHLAQWRNERERFLWELLLCCLKTFLCVLHALTSWLNVGLCSLDISLIRLFRLRIIIFDHMFNRWWGLIDFFKWSILIFMIALRFIFLFTWLLLVLVFWAALHCSRSKWKRFAFQYRSSYFLSSS